MVHTFPGRFSGKVVAITGGASGMGAAMVERYVAEGAKVLIADMCPVEKGQQLASRYPKGLVYFHRVDISDSEQATSVVTETIKQFGDIDIVHNNASAVVWGAVDEMDPSQWSRCFKVGVDGPFWICRAVIPHFKKKQGGNIINTISTAGLIGDKGFACYCAVKAALANLTRAMAGDHAQHGIRINAVAPGWCDTAMATALSATPEIKEMVASSTPMHRPGTPAELAAVLMFLASDDASFVTGVGK
jgi:meso-butanediol dehydrogenase/(S,S)-butanediol dehydrogenase/diacetyl reductase